VQRLRAGQGGLSGAQVLGTADASVLFTDPWADQTGQAVAYPFNLFLPYAILTCTQVGRLGSPSSTPASAVHLHEQTAMNCRLRLVPAPNFPRALGTQWSTLPATSGYSVRAAACFQCAVCASPLPAAATPAAKGRDCQVGCSSCGARTPEHRKAAGEELCVQAATSQQCMQPSTMHLWHTR
jgi:hypothetical protein